jgi:uncharacterized protein YprB with RNaseH-like and TPR domain
VLRKTFCHIPALGKETELSLWSQGCDDWDTYLANPKEFRTGSASRDDVTRAVEKSKEALETGNYQHFRRSLGQEAWRAWPEFEQSCVYLDIETDGGRSGNAVTIVGLYDGAEFTALVRGIDLGNFLDSISNYGLIVTFFGTSFDLPMLEKKFYGHKFDQIHIDLCFVLKRLGYSGGLKKIERQLGISRADEVDGLTGLDAVRLWNRYERGDEGALKTLIAYNEEDVVNLKTLAKIAYDGLVAKTVPVPASS